MNHSKNKGCNEKFRWKPSAVKVKLSPEVYGAAMKRVANRNGGDLTDVAMVDEARPDISDIHNAFEWDDSIASEKYRIEQAAWYRRHIIVIVAKEGNDKTIHSNKFSRIAYVSVKNDSGERVHRDAVQVMTAEDTRLQAIDDCMRLLMSIRKRFAHLSDIASINRVFQVIDEVVQSIGKAI